MTPARLAMTGVRLAAASTAVARLSRAARRRAPISPASAGPTSIAVVIPARDEARRIGPLLAAVTGAPGVVDVVVVDDESTDGTADVVHRAGARLVHGRPLPTGWVGKAWALQQGLEETTSEWVVALDADARPDPSLPQALAARLRTDGLDLITVAGRFDCPTGVLRWLHPAMLTTLLYRGTTPGAISPGPVHRRMGNGQCMAFRRTALLDAGGFATVAHHTVEDVALVRGFAGAGQAVEFLDATSLLEVRMFESAWEAWPGWARSLSLPGVDPRWRRGIDLLAVMLAQAAPLLRLVARRADALDLVLLGVRLGTLVGARRAYRRHGWAYWLSPLADPLAILALARGLASRRQRWRGRAY